MSLVLIATNIRQMHCLTLRIATLSLQKNKAALIRTAFYRGLNDYFVLVTDQVDNRPNSRDNDTSAANPSFSAMC